MKSAFSWSLRSRSVGLRGYLPLLKSTMRSRTPNWGGLAVEAWNAKERSPDYDEEALDESWGMVAEAFNVDHYGELRYVAVNRGADSIGVVPTEWKGDNRFFRPQDGERLPLDVSDEELGAAVRRAMELTVS